MHNHSSNEKIRNIAIIAHVDHGKTTIVDAMFRQSGLFREGQSVDERVMDKMDLEKERGITIAAKNCNIKWKETKINILDTPGHADFGGEVERALSMVDGVLLLVDASEGPLPQTRFVLSKALAAKLSLIVVINKIDRQDARPLEVVDEVVDLLIDLDVSEDQLDFPLLFANGKAGIAKKDLEDKSENIHILLDTIIEEIPPPQFDESKPFQMLVSDLDYSNFLGRLAIGKVVNGRTESKAKLLKIGTDNKTVPLKVTSLQIFDGVGLTNVAEVEPGDIVVLSGIDDVEIGDTICTSEDTAALKRITVDDPTVAMTFYPNNSPLSGQEGKIVQSSKIRDRLKKETLRNVSIHVEEDSGKEAFIVKGRGEFQMAILIETMRREGFEICVGRPQVIFKTIDGKKHEPVEIVSIDCEEAYSGIVTEKLNIRKGRMTNFVNHGSGRIRLEFSIPSRGLIGYRDEFLTDTRGTGILNSYFSGYEPYRGDFPTRQTGSLVADRSGKAIPYAIFNLEPRGRMLVKPGDKIYEGMIAGEHNRENDLDVNICREKKLSNMRASGKDEAIILTPILPLTLESALNLIKDDELVEVTPASIRLRKIHLTAADRKRLAKQK